MHRSVSACFAALLSLAVAPTAHATPLRLTLEDAVGRASGANLELAASRKDLDVAQANLDRSKAWVPSNPSLTGGAQHTIGFGPNYSFLLSQELEIGGQRGHRIAASNQDMERVSAEVQSAQLTLSASVKAVFIHALVNMQRVTAAQAALDAAHELAAHAAELPHPSELQRIDLNIAQIQEVHAQRDLASVEQARDGTLLALRRLVGLPLDQELELAGAPESTRRDLPATPALVERALRERADLAALRHGLQRGDLQIAVTKSEAVPNITLSGNYARFEGATLIGGDLGVPIPVFNRKSGELQEAVAERDRLRLQVQNLEREIQKEVLEARRACTIAGDNMVAHQRVILPKSEENAQLERRLYERGEVSVSDLIGIQVDAVTARREYLDAIEAYNTSLIELQRVTGGAPVSSE